MKRISFIGAGFAAEVTGLLKAAAAAAAANLLAELRGEPATATFKVELVRAGSVC